MNTDLLFISEHSAIKFCRKGICKASCWPELPSWCR